MSVISSWPFSPPLKRTNTKKDITKKNAKLQNQKDHMLIEIKGYAKFERVLWGEVDKGCSNMLVVIASVWRMGRRCGVVWYDFDGYFNILRV
jgi:hypothetical protein